MHKSIWHIVKDKEVNKQIDQIYFVWENDCFMLWPVHSGPCWKISLKLCQGERKKKKEGGGKNPCELNKTVWLKFKQGWSLFLTQWLSAYAGPRSLCPRPRSLWRARSFYIFTKSEENKLLTHSWSGAEETIWLQFAASPPHSVVWKPVCLSRMQCVLPPSSSARLIFLSQRHLLPSERNRKSSRSSCQDEHQGHLSWNFFFLCVAFYSFGPYIFFSFFFFSTEVGICDRLCVCVCVYCTIWAEPCTCALSAPAQGNS